MAFRGFSRMGQGALSVSLVCLCVAVGLPGLVNSAPSHEYIGPGTGGPGYRSQVQIAADPSVLSSLTSPLPAVTSPTPIQIVLTEHPQRGSAPLFVSYSAIATGGNGTRVLTFNWTFGDGAHYDTSVGADATWQATSLITHVFNSSGSWITTIRVWDNLAGDAPKQTTATITVTKPMVVSVTPSSPKVTAGRPIVLTANVTGGLAPYLPNWTDSNHQHLANCAQAGLTLTCSPAQPAANNTTLTVLVSVSDAASNVATASVNYVVTLKFDPTAGFATRYACSGSSAVVTGTYSTSLSGGTPGYSVVWSFGDGSPTVAQLSGNHSFPAGSTYTVTFTASDASDATSTRTFNVSTSYPACSQIAPPSYAPPIVFLEASTGILVVVIAIMALVLVRGLRTSPLPPTSRAPVAGWSAPDAGSSSPGPSPPPGAR